MGSRDSRRSKTGDRAEEQSRDTRSPDRSGDSYRSSGRTERIARLHGGLGNQNVMRLSRSGRNPSRSGVQDGGFETGNRHGGSEPHTPDTDATAVEASRGRPGGNTTRCEVDSGPNQYLHRGSIQRKAVDADPASKFGRSRSEAGIDGPRAEISELASATRAVIHRSPGNNSGRSRGGANSSSKSGGSNAIFSVTRNQKTKKLTRGSSSKGWKHIKERHITGNQAKSGTITTFFPVGQTVTIDGSTVQLDQTMSVSDVKSVIETAVKQGSRDQSDPGEVYVYSHSFDIDDVRVVVGGGEVITAYPIEGPKTPAYDPNSGWKNV